MSEELQKSNFIWEPSSWAFSDSHHSCSGGDKKGKKSSSTNSTPVMTPIPTPTPSTTPSTPVGDQQQIHNGVFSNEKVEINASGGGEVGESDHGIHIWTERERRKKMRNMFSSLHSLLPQLPPKADKSTIVDEAVSYIKALENTLRKMQKLKLEKLGKLSTTNIEASLVTQNMMYNSTRESYLAEQVCSMDSGMTSSSLNSLLVMPGIPSYFHTWSSPNVVLNVSGKDAHINVCAPKKPTMFTTIACVLEKHRIDVVTAHLYSDPFRNMYMIHAHANTVSDHLQQLLPAEEVFKLAVGEIIFWIST